MHAALAEAGITPPEVDRCSATRVDEDGKPRYEWRPAPPEVDAEHRKLVIRLAITERLRWRIEYAEARARAGPNDDRSAPTPEPATAVA